MNNAPIRCLTTWVLVARAVIDKLPDEDHLPGRLPSADTCDRAGRSPDPVRPRRGWPRAESKAWSFACNTATAARARGRARSCGRWRHPVIGITPAARQAIIATRNHHVSVIGTKATIQSEAYLRALAAVPGPTVSQQACPAFVEFVEAGVTTGEEIESVARGT